MSDTSPFGFGRFVPGFDFLQNLAKNASEGSNKLPGLSSWIAPTMSVEDVEKRVEELKAVQFWLEQNSRALSATIQALEVQKMTLSTLKGMNVSMGDMASLFQPKAGSDAAPKPGDALTGAAQAMTDAMVRATTAFTAPMAQAAKSGKADKAPAPAAEAPARDDRQERSAAQDPAASTASGGAVDPMQWWGALTQQFQQIAANALADVAKQTSLENAADLTQEAFKTATGLATQIGSATGLGKMQDAVTGKKGAAKKKPAAPGSQQAASDAADATDTAQAAAAAKKAPARRAAAPSKRARG